MKLKGVILYNKTNAIPSLKFVSYLIIRFFIFIFGLLPFRAIYLLSDAIRFMLHRVLAYRKDVMVANLKASFPEKSESHYNHIIKCAYQNLADIMVEGIKGGSMTKKQIVRRYKFINPEILDQAYEEGKSVILVAGHYNNWEWAALSPPYFFNHQLVALYKRLHNPYLNRYMKNSRSHTGVKMYEIQKTARAFQIHEDKEQPSIYLMAADQSPSNTDKAVWLQFLNQDTACLHGPEKYARKYNLPVVFAYPQRVQRGFYEVRLEWLVRDVGQCDDGKITTLFMKRLEELIIEQPENWLWTHKRWKHRREEV
ncbi:lysophospholipid acyltransferase family protein [Portibacter marinus]|uniref:lysophospholipid acyltransferase family protein n=1 Tax=Portibacter marinus TaxID=2898660 RepID=UPI001F4194F9|nr:lysophospholipid acyltransferase family protein [Portibacter marinus]